MKYHGSTGPEHEDMLYSMYLTGPDGARFILWRDKHHTPEDIKKAKGYLKVNQDVMSISVEKDY